MMLLSNKSNEGVLRVLDPMCGWGTLPLALRWVQTHHTASLKRPAALEILGTEIRASKVFGAQRNSDGAIRCTAGGTHKFAPQCPVSFVNARSDSLPLTSNSVDLIIVDPPWGTLGNKDEYVKQ